MATTTLRPLRVFRNYHVCQSCDNKWTDEALTVSDSWCPYCGAKTAPCFSEELLEDVLYSVEEDE